MTYDWINGLPVQTDTTNFEWVGGLPYVITELATGTNMQINIGDVWKTVTGLQINIGDTWKTVTKVQINVGDTWKTIFG
jgi:hypothetical protein